MSARIAYTNLLIASGVTITSSADADGYPASNLANPARWKKWRSSTTTGDQWVKFDLGSNLSFQLLAATDVTLHTGGGTLHAQANATDVWGAPTVDDALTVPSPDFTHVLADWLSAVKSLRYIRFYFTNVGASSSYVEIGAAFAGTYFEPSQSIGQSAVTISRHDLSVHRLALGGERSTVVRPKYHVISGAFPAQSAADRDTWRTVFDGNGIALPCVFSLTPGTASLTYYGTLASDLSPRLNSAASNLWDIPFQFTEDVA